MSHGPTDLLQHLLARLAQLVFQMDVGCGKERVNAWAGRAFQGFPGTSNIHFIGSRQGSNDRTTDFCRNGLHGLEIAIRRNRESCFKDVNSQAIKLPRHLQLFFKIHAASRRLLAIT